MIELKVCFFLRLLSLFVVDVVAVVVIVGFVPVVVVIVLFFFLISCSIVDFANPV